MDVDPKLSRELFVQLMRAKMGAMLGQVAYAVDEAPPGYLVSGSEEQVRDLFTDLQREAYEKAPRMWADAAEAAFPPSEGPGDGR
ncbi:MAG: hypothetical protein KGM43_01940 [Planctomycetota bacterium]|nr:hypothetical protein [Planctomycetota bacterium]